MKCPNCGFEFDEGVFCPECGTKCVEEPALTYEEKKQMEEEEKQKRELELAKAKADQERFAKEKAEKEAELLKQKNENLRIEQEMEARKAEVEKQKQEELTRTFNGTVYNSIEEMNLAKSSFEQESVQREAMNKTNKKAMWSLILGIAAWPLMFTIVGWMPAMIVSIVLGVSALKENTEKRSMAIIGIILSAAIIVIGAIGVIGAILSGT